MSAQIEAVTAIAIAKSPVHRFATADDLASAFRRAVAGKLDVAIARRAALLLTSTPWGGWGSGRR